MTDNNKHLSYKEHRDAVVRAALANPDHPMLYRPGSDSRAFSGSLSSLGDNEYLSRKHILGQRSDFNFQEILKRNGLQEVSLGKLHADGLLKGQQLMQSLPIRALGESESRMINYGAVNADFDGAAIGLMSWKPMVFQVLHVGFNYYELLKKHLGKIKEEEIRLPFEYCTFELNYIPGGKSITVHQDQVTKKISVVDKYGHVLSPMPETLGDVPLDLFMDGRTMARMNIARLEEEQEETTDNHQGIPIASADPKGVKVGEDFEDNLNRVFRDPYSYLQHIFAVCAAIDAKLIARQEVMDDLGKAPRKTKQGGIIFKILPLRSAKQAVVRHNINTGRKSPALHVRRGHDLKTHGKKVWRRWTIVGDVFSGIVFKEYGI